MEQLQKAESPVQVSDAVAKAQALIEESRMLLERSQQLMLTTETHRYLRGDRGS